MLLIISNFSVFIIVAGQNGGKFIAADAEHRAVVEGVADYGRSAADKFIAVTEGKTMTDLARSVAPPTKKKDSWWAVIIFGVAAYGLFNISPLLALCEIAVACCFIKVNIDINDYNEKI